MEAPPKTARIHLLVPWLLMLLAAACALGVLAATIYWWPTFGLLGKGVATGVVLFAFGALAALTLVFVNRILRPVLRHRHDDTF